MYKKFMELFGKENLLDRAIHTTEEMLKTDREMFEESVHSCAVMTTPFSHLISMKRTSR